MEQIVKTCDQCQRAGKPNDKKKAPLKLVPVIQEVFTKLNIDACGPLPITSKGNLYLITAICACHQSSLELFRCLILVPLVSQLRC
ncbi:retrovirus-related Pol polyprotein from transposon 17.6 [Trichonephila clavipes]|nr:retrovirus-related Pol polyprotein from transposon 17.6 [Trichonephila clavipes]